MEDKMFLQSWAPGALMQAMDQHIGDRAVWEALALWYISGRDFSPYDRLWFSPPQTHGQIREHAGRLRAGFIRELEASVEEGTVRFSLPSDRMAHLMASPDRAIRKICLRAGGKPSRPTDLPSSQGRKSGAAGNPRVGTVSVSPGQVQPLNRPGFAGGSKP